MYLLKLVYAFGPRVDGLTSLIVSFLIVYVTILPRIIVTRVQLLPEFYLSQKIPSRIAIQKILASWVLGSTSSKWYI